MIIRRDGEDLLLITQPDHAILSETIMRRWLGNGFATAERRDLVLLAVQRHDNGWIEPDSRPIVDIGSGRLLDFLHAPDAVRVGVWPRGVARLASTPYTAALVAEHALQIYRHYRKQPAWRPFFRDMERERDRHLSRAHPLTLDELQRDYFFVRVGDMLSLIFCNNWPEPIEDSGYRFRLHGSSLCITPDPFATKQVPLAVVARRIPDRAYTETAAAEACANAPTEVLRGLAVGT